MSSFFQVTKNQDSVTYWNSFKYVTSGWSLASETHYRYVSLAFPLKAIAVTFCMPPSPFVLFDVWCPQSSGGRHHCCHMGQVRKPGSERWSNLCPITPSQWGRVRTGSGIRTPISSFHESYLAIPEGTPSEKRDQLEPSLTNPTPHA